MKTSNQHKVTTWYEVLLYSGQMPARAEHIKASAYQASCGFVPALEFNKNYDVLHVVEYLQLPGSLPERPLRYFDKLHECTCESHADGRTFMTVSDFLILPPSQIGKFSKLAAKPKVPTRGEVSAMLMKQADARSYYFNIRKK